MCKRRSDTLPFFHPVSFVQCYLHVPGGKSILLSERSKSNWRAYLWQSFWYHWGVTLILVSSLPFYMVREMTLLPLFSIYFRAPAGIEPSPVSGALWLEGWERSVRALQAFTQQQVEEMFSRNETVAVRIEPGWWISCGLMTKMFPLSES